MVNESIALPSTGFELATFGEVLYAFSALRSTSGRRRGACTASELLPWGPCPGPGQPAKSRRASGRCHCGQCRNCQENARWERIFQEKFANSDYYHHDIRIRYASPLGSA